MSGRMIAGYAGAGLLLAGAVTLLLVEKRVGSSPVRPQALQRACQYSSFSDDSTIFVKAYRDSSLVRHLDERGAAPQIGAIRGGIVSHHLLIGSVIARYFEELGEQMHPRTVIILGPNHRARGKDAIAVSRLPWKTPFGFVDADGALIGRLLSGGLAVENEDAFFQEHSIGALVPFLKRTFPEARVVPLIFRKDADTSACMRLGRWLATNTDRSTLLLGSMDFSHYKTSALARQDDARSLPVLAALAVDDVGKVTVDSRPALRTLLLACRDMGAYDASVVFHSNSGILLRVPDTPCTSYINILFRTLREQ